MRCRCHPLSPARITPHAARLARSVVLLGAVALCAAPGVSAQPVATSTVRGVVLAPNGKPVHAVRVSLLETDEQAATDSLGRFVLRTVYRGVATLVARRIASNPAAIDILIPIDTAVVLHLVAQPPALATMTVVAAGEYTLGTGRTATLTPLQVVQTPGAAGNVMRALQTLPGPQAVDEGSGLFVRGGDVSETRVLVDDAWLLSPVRTDNPTGHVTSSVNPFLLDRTIFSSGGFGAQYGNALSGVVRLETAGRPERTTATANVSVGGAGVAIAMAPARRFGARLSADVTTLAPLLAVFGEAQPYDPPPRGGDVSATAEWQSSRAGRVRVFAVRQASRFGVGDAGVVSGATYASRTTQDMTVLSWRDSSRRLRPAVTVARSAFDRHEDISGAALDTRLAVTHALATLRYPLRDGVEVTAGGDVEWLSARYAGDGVASDGAQPRAAFLAVSSSDRVGTFAEVRWQDARGLRVIAGARTDASSLTRVRTTEPRLSLAWQHGTLGLTAAWGVQHQVAEPVFRRTSGTPPGFAPMRAAQAILGAQWGGDSAGVRLELYDKRYRDLWQFTRDFGVAGAGRGRAVGADLLVRWRIGTAVASRVAWSVVDSRRTDPTTGRDAPALGDVRHSVSWITDRTFGRLSVSSAVRYATGRPFTDVVGVAGGAPVWGEPNAARLPGYMRSDLSVSWYRPIDARRGVVLWGSLSNVFNRTNVMRYRWNADFQERLAVRAPFNRSLYAGATLLL